MLIWVVTNQSAENDHMTSPNEAKITAFVWNKFIKIQDGHFATNFWLKPLATVCFDWQVP